MGERFYWLGFSVFSGVGPVKFKLLLDNFGSAKEAWNASSKDLIKIGFGKALTAKFEKFKTNFSIENYIKLLQCKGSTFTCWSEDSYPKLLKQIKNPPFVIYIKDELRLGNKNFPLNLSVGDSSSLASELSRLPSGSNIHSSRSSKLPPSSLVWNADRIIAVVGTRKITSYGEEVTRLLTQELVDAGFTIVSGLALGVDVTAHQAAIEANGKTIAVLGSGVDLCYPSANKHIYNSIIGGYGAVVSEFPLGQKPSKGSFPSRNRIIAGLSLGVLVTEGAEDSGALITADYAIQNKRKVFAVPGPITSSLSKGPYKLISKGAKLVTSAKDILEELSIKSSNPTSPRLRGVKGETKEENLILKILVNEPVHFDQIVRRSGLPSSKVGSILSIIEIKGLVKGLGNGLFSIAA